MIETFFISEKVGHYSDGVDEWNSHNLEMWVPLPPIFGKLVLQNIWDFNFRSGLYVLDKVYKFCKITRIIKLWAVNTLTLIAYISNLLHIGTCSHFPIFKHARHFESPRLPFTSLSGIYIWWKPKKHDFIWIYFILYAYARWFLIDEPQI